MNEAHARKHPTRKAPRVRQIHEAPYTFPPNEKVLTLKPNGSIVTTVRGDMEREVEHRFTAIQIELPTGRMVSIQELVENYAG